MHRRQLGAELRRLREAAGFKAKDAAQALGCSETRVSRIETAKGRYVAHAGDVTELCKLYGVTDERKIQMLLDMLTLGQQPGWWERYEDVLPSGLEVLVGLESDARAERAWEPLLIHGLLQTDAYARAVLESYPGNRQTDVHALVQLRAERRRLLQGDKPLELWAILDEAAIRRPVGGASVMRDQLLHIADSAAAPNVTVQVIPRRIGQHPGLGGAFSLLDFEEPEDTVVYVDSPAGNLYLEKRNDVRRFASSFDLLRALALAPDESVTLVRAAAEEMT